ncbi:MAG TPA: phage terminase large subunit [Gemmataceae bacterium]
MPPSIFAEPLALALDPGRILRAQGLAPDPWQRRFLLAGDRRVLLCCSRGAGKSRAASAKALHRALFHPGSLVLLLSRSRRQSAELFRYVMQGYAALGRPVRSVRANETALELANGSRVVSLPGREETIRSFQGVDLLVIDEAARVPDELYRSVRPMLGVSRGRLVALSTPFGRRGWFWKAWGEEGGAWQRVEVPWTECPRLTPEFIAEERRACGAAWVAQEYECSFESVAGLVYPGLARRCAAEAPGGVAGRPVGGIDFGFRNPFAAVWGYLDGDDVLWVVGEHYRRGAGLHEHAAALPRGFTWYADPAHPTEIHALCRAGLVVRKAHNAVRAGIAAVRARAETGRLRIDPARCPNLLREASLYHYDPGGDSETPVDADNHALAALRYLVSRIDANFLGRYLRDAGGGEKEAAAPPGAGRADDAALWEPVGW